MQPLEREGKAGREGTGWLVGEGGANGRLTHAAIQGVASSSGWRAVVVDTVMLGRGKSAMCVCVCVSLAELDGWMGKSCLWISFGFVFSWD